MIVIKFSTRVLITEPLWIGNCIAVTPAMRANGQPLEGDFATLTCLKSGRRIGPIVPTQLALASAPQIDAALCCGDSVTAHALADTMDMPVPVLAQAA